jgi:hypothetical protein
MKRVIKTTHAAAMYNPVSQATVAPNGMLYTAAWSDGRLKVATCCKPLTSRPIRLCET